MSISHFDLHCLRRMISLYLIKKKEKKTEEWYHRTYKKENDIHRSISDMLFN